MNRKTVKNSLQGIAQTHIARIGKSLKFQGPVFSTKHLKLNSYKVLDVRREEGEVLIQSKDGNQFIVGLISFKLTNKEMAKPMWTRGIPDNEHVTNINGKDLEKPCSRTVALESLKAETSPSQLGRV